MSEGTVSDDGRYWAFISYSHKDAAFGRRLHRRLEAYAVPRRLVGRVTPQGAASRRLIPIFRDREELPAAKDLSAEVRAALKVSRCLIVVCSPAAAASPWVAREVELFRALHPGRPILAAIREGEPADSIPAVLRPMGSAGEHIEPLAADFRRGHDGWELGLLKLVAGVLGVGLDELVQRDSQRHAQRVTAVTAAALVAVLVMGVLTLFALNARQEAERQRAEAEGLVEFMLTDLRTELKGVGRLDAMTTVNERALKYYSDQDLDRLPPNSLERRARVLHAMGEDDETRGDHEAALAKFREARRTTAALLAAAPNDPERIFAQAQSEYWLGNVDYNRGRFAGAELAFQTYKRLADQLLFVAPDDPRSMREVAFAEGNLCSVALQPPKKPKAALELCEAALRHMKAAASRSMASVGLTQDLINRHGWLADAYLANGDYERAMGERQIQERMLQGLMNADPKNMDLKSFWIAIQRIMAWMDAKEGHRERALERIRRATAVIVDLIAFDSANQVWTGQRIKLASDLSKITSMSGQGSGK